MVFLHDNITLLLNTKSGNKIKEYKSTTKFENLGNPDNLDDPKAKNLNMY
jgi:hypothetical protein